MSCRGWSKMGVLCVLWVLGNIGMSTAERIMPQPPRVARATRTGRTGRTGRTDLAFCDYREFGRLQRRRRRLPVICFQGRIPRRVASDDGRQQLEEYREKISEKNNEKYYLLWSSGFMKKFMAGSLATTAISAAMSASWMTSWMGQPSCHGVSAMPRQVRTFQSVVLPLLASSCCAIQLFVNAVSGLGCVGFNTYLGPLRPYFLSVFLFSLCKSLPHRPLQWTVTSIVLAILPEFISILNTWQNQTLASQRIDNNNNGNNNRNNNSTIHSNKKTVTLQLDIPSMGCVACVNKVNSSIRKRTTLPIQRETSWLNEGTKGGMAQVEFLVEGEEDAKQMAQVIASTLDDAGFQCHIQSMTIV